MPCGSGPNESAQETQRGRGFGPALECFKGADEPPAMVQTRSYFRVNRRIRKEARFRLEHEEAVGNRNLLGVQPHVRPRVDVDAK